MRIVKNSLLGVLLAIAACAPLAGCQRGAPETAEPEVRPVRSITIAKSEGGSTVALSGRIAAEDEVALAFRIPGRLIERTVNVGDRVRAGQVLARLEQMNERNQLLSAQAALNAANADLIRARDEYARQKSLIDEGFTTRAQLDQATAAFRAAEAQVKSATAQVSMAQDLVGFTVLTAEAPGAVIGDEFGKGRLGIRVVADQRVEMGPALGGEDAGDGPRIPGIGAQPVDRLGGEGDQLPGAEQRRGLGDRTGRQQAGHGSTTPAVARKRGFRQPGLP